MPKARAETRWPGRWIAALKPNSWSKLLVPWVFGQCLGAVHAGEFSFPAVVMGGAFTVFGLAYIVLLNDWSDANVDRIKRSMFPDGCSEKTIPDGHMGARQVLLGGLAAAVLALAAAAAGASFFGRPALFYFAVACMALFLAYSTPPIQLNYRGGGELLEMLGVGVALPAWNAYCQSAAILGPSPLLPWTWNHDLWVVLLGSGLLAFASAVASGLSDEVSDRAGGKRTVASMFGNRWARLVVEVSVLAGAIAWMLGAIWSSAGELRVSLIVGGLMVLAHLWPLRRRSTRARTNAFAEQGKFKRCLHQAIHRGVLILGGVAVIGRLFAS